jgi:hypothetical protein
VLPQVFNESAAADKGSAGHEHMALRVSHGVDHAVEQLDAIIARHNLDERDAGILRSRLMRFEWMVPTGAISEVRLALMQDWSVVRVPDDQRYYPGSIFTGQFDLAWAEPQPLIFEEDKEPRCPPNSVLWVLDWKFGLDSWVHTIETNLQVRLYAWLAARWTGAKAVVPAVVFPSAGQGDWDVPDSPLGPADLDAVEQRIRDLLAGVERNRVKLAKGEPLELTESRLCEYCPARTHCPAKTAMYKRVFNEGSEAVLGDAALSPEQARYAAIALPQFERFARDLRALLENYVKENGPIELEDGVVWGPERTTRDVVLSEAARPILVKELGEEYADSALRSKVSKKSIADAVKAMHDEKGIKRRQTATVGRILGALRARGAIVPEESAIWRAHRPKDQLPAARSGDIDE